MAALAAFAAVNVVNLAGLVSMRPEGSALHLYLVFGTHIVVLFGSIIITALVTEDRPAKWFGRDGGRRPPQIPPEMSPAGVPRGPRRPPSLVARAVAAGGRG